MTFKNLLSGENGKKILIVGAAAVLLLLLLSSVFGGGSKKNSSKIKEEKTLTVEDAAELEKTLEARVKSLVESIDGAGTATVMVTLDRSSTLMFDKDERLEQKGESGSGSINRETETVLAGSSKEPLRTGVVLPKVRGAAVVCSGADDPVVREKVTNAVAKALNIGVSRVYVTY